MARNYQYGTNPRKVEPNYKPKRKPTKKKINKKPIIKDNLEQIKNLKMEKREHHKNIAIIVGMFLVLLVVSYRDSLITEKFNEIQKLKSNLASIEKTNEQLLVSIEGSLNLSNIEKVAKKKLGMKKLSDKQKVYVELPKKDYTEATTESIKIEDNSNWFQKIFNKLFKN